MIKQIEIEIESPSKLLSILEWHIKTMKEINSGESAPDLNTVILYVLKDTEGKNILLTWKPKYEGREIVNL